MSGNDKHTRSSHKEKSSKPHPAAPINKGPLAQYVEPDLLALQRTVARPDLASPADILDLQRTVGNRAVQRLLARSQGGEYGLAARGVSADLTIQCGRHPERARQSNLTGGVPRSHERQPAAQRDLLARPPTGASRIVQRAYNLVSEGRPLPGGTIVACRNPSQRGERMVRGRMGGASQRLPGSRADLTHAGILAEGGTQIIEAMGPGVQKNPVEGHPAAKDAKVCSSSAKTGVTPDKIEVAAKAAVGKAVPVLGRTRIKGTETYALLRAKAAVKKGELQHVRDLIAERIRRKGGNPAYGSSREHMDLDKIEEQITKLEEKHDYPELKREGLHRPTGGTYCVQFVVQAVQAALENDRRHEDAETWKEHVGKLPTVRDLYDALSPDWKDAKGLGDIEVENPGLTM